MARWRALSFLSCLLFPVTCGVQRCCLLWLLYFSWRDLTIDIQVRSVVLSSKRAWRSSAFNLKASISHLWKVVAAMTDILLGSASTPLIWRQSSTTRSPKESKSFPGSLIKDIPLISSTRVWLSAEFVCSIFPITEKKASGTVGSVPRVFLRPSYNYIVTLATMAFPIQRRLLVL